MGNSYTLQTGMAGDYSLEVVTEKELEPPEVARVLAMFSTLKRGLPALARLYCVLAAPGPPMRFDYGMELADGRRWQQEIHFNGPPSDPEMTFTVDNTWRLSEFSHHRDIRLLCIELVEKQEMERLEVIFFE